MIRSTPRSTRILCLLASVLAMAAGCDDGGTDADPSMDAMSDMSTDVLADGSSTRDLADVFADADTLEGGPSWRTSVDAAEHALGALRAEAVVLEDLDGDGLAEIGVFDEADESGVLRIHRLPEGAGDRDAAAFEITGLGVGTTLGAQLHASTGDFDGDGTLDIAVTYPAYDDPDDSGTDDGGVAIFHGPFDGDRAAADADAIIRIGDSLDLSAIVKLHRATLDGDAVDDLVLEREIDVTLVHGPFVPDADGAPYAIADNGIELDGENSSFPTSVAVADTDGDGLDDVIVSDSPVLRNDTTVDAVFVFRAPFDAARDTSAADVTLTDDGSQPGFGASVLAVPDTNGDGLPDLVATAVETNVTPIDEHVGAGWIGLFESPLQTGGPDLAAATIAGETVGDRFAAYLAAGDLNGDGALDIVATPDRWTNAFSVEPSALHVILGPFEGNRSAADAEVVLDARTPTERLGVAGLAIRQVAGDDAPDLVVGWPGNGDQPSGALVFEGGQ